MCVCVCEREIERERKRERERERERESTHTREYLFVWGLSWYIGYRHNKWTRRSELKDWTRYCISHNANTLGKVLNSIILLPALGK